MHHDPLFYRHLIFWVWVAFALYWLIAAFNTKRTQRREPLRSRLLYISALVLGGVLIGWHHSAWGELLTRRLWPRSASLYFVGLAILIAGVAFAVWARVHLGRNWSGNVTVKEGHELIRSGPYAFVRHPIYTGILAAVLGTAVCSGTVRALVGLLIITAALIVKLRAEERFMRETFPGQYERYSAEVPALVPFTKVRRAAPP